MTAHCPTPRVYTPSVLALFRNVVWNCVFVDVLALPVGHQEYHGFLFADLGHDGGELVQVAAVEVLSLPEVQDRRRRTGFGREEAHVSAYKETETSSEISLEEKHHGFVRV